MFLSVLSPYYYYYVSEMKYDAVTNHFAFSYYQATELEAEEVIQPIKNIAESQGYRLLSVDMAKQVLPAIETECLEKGQVTVFNCVFSELFNPH